MEYDYGSSRDKHAKMIFFVSPKATICLAKNATKMLKLIHLSPEVLQCKKSSEHRFKT